MPIGRRWFTALLLFVAVSVAGLGIRPLIVPDEPRYGIIPAEMVETGNWLALRMNGFVYYEKPPLGYWLTAASISAFGQNAFAIRLPSALATGVVALVAAWMATRVSGRREDGPLAFMVQATTLGPLVLGSVALLDPPFAAFVALSMGALFCATQSIGRTRAGWLALAGVAAGFAFLTKGLLAIAIPGAAALMFLAWERRWKDMLTMPWIPLAAAAVTVAPFAWMIHRAEPGFWEYFIVVEHFRRAAQPDSNQHPEPAWFFLVMFPIGAMLWTLTWPTAWKGLRGAPEWRSGVRFMLSWIVAPIALLSLSSGKLPTYVLPMFAPAAVLAALGLVRAHELGAMKKVGAATAVRWVLRAVATAAFVLAAVGLRRVGLPAPWEEGEWLILAWIGVAILAWAQLDAWAWRAPDGRTWVARNAVAPVLVMVAIPFLYPAAILSASKHPWRALARHADEFRSAGLVVSGSSTAHAVCWAAGRRDVVIGGSPSEFDNELGIESEAPRRIGWNAVGPRIAEARAAVPARSVSVVCPNDAVGTILGAPGVTPPDVRETMGQLSILSWR